MFDTPIIKNVGVNYEVICDRKTHVVSIYQHDKLIKSYKFDKLGDSVTFYAKLKTVKNIKRADVLYFDCI